MSPQDQQGHRSDADAGAIAAVPTVTVGDPTSSGRLPQRIGQYSIKRVIATGGMGTVYEALQEKPRRTVAVKVMRRGIASRSALRRFDYEAQLLARLRHPGIAQVYDAGTHRDGEVTVPYFAMEYIVGAKPITNYVKDKKLGTRERMKLFANVCEAVHHGHQKGIIHRDLKPSNILIDSSGQAKIIDFGVARSTDSDMAVTTLQTDVGQLIGTLQYMSPEQCAADPHDIDTRSDVYALGVVFYEVLCERSPYEIRGAAIHEATRVIREQQPTRLSTLNRTLRGDVETMALKALEKDRDRRYQSATELAADIQRYLNNEVISAHPPSVAYQLRVFARRNKGLITAVAAVFAVLVAGVIVSTTQYLKADAARRDAEAARSQATRRAEELDEIAKFQETQLTSIEVPLMAVRLRNGLIEKARIASSRLDPEDADARTAQLEELLVDVDLTGLALNVLDENIFERTVENIDVQFESRPLIRARLLQALADTAVALGLLERAASPQKNALEIRRRVLGSEHPDTLNSIHSMGWFLHAQGKFVDAVTFLREAIEGQRRVLGDDHPDTLASMNCMGHLLLDLNRITDAERYTRAALEGRRRILGNDHPDTLVSITNMVSCLISQGRRDEAMLYSRESLEGCRRLLGNDHSATLDAIKKMAEALNLADLPAESEKYFREALDGHRRVLGEDHTDTLFSYYDLGNVLNRLGRYDDAARLLSSREATARRVWTGDNVKWLGIYLEALGGARTGLKQFNDAERTLLESFELLEAGFGNSWRTRKTVEHLVKLYDAWDDAASDQGYGASAAQWRARLEVLGTRAQMHEGTTAGHEPTRGQAEQPAP